MNYFLARRDYLRKQLDFRRSVALYYPHLGRYGNLSFESYWCGNNRWLEPDIENFNRYWRGRSYYGRKYGDKKIKDEVLLFKVFGGYTGINL